MYVVYMHLPEPAILHGVPQQEPRKLCKAPPKKLETSKDPAKIHTEAHNPKHAAMIMITEQ